MEKLNIINMLAALAHETRLDIYRYLVQRGQHGMAAGEIAEHFALPLATLSFHLKTLKQAGLVNCQRQGRSLLYSADYTAMNTLLSYLTHNCCIGDGQTCDIPLCDADNATGRADDSA